MSPQVSAIRRAATLCFAAVFAILVLLQPSISLGEDSLVELRSDVRTANSSSSSNNQDDDHHHKKKRRNHHAGCDCHYCCDEPSALDDLKSTLALGVLYVGGMAITSPFWGPPAYIGDTYESSGFFAKHPFHDRTPGYMMVDPVFPSEPYNWSLRFRSEYADDFDDMSRIGGHVLYETTSRFGFDTEFNHRTQDLAGGMTDELWTGDFNVTYRFAQSPTVQMRTGLGFNYLSDSSSNDFGFNFTYGGDWFPRRPWIFSADMDWGTLGNTNLFHGRATAGVQFHGIEVFTGYDYYDVGDTQIGGLISGLRLWF